MLEIKNISKSFPNFSLKDISLTVEKGDYFVLLGGSGNGKSVLLEIIAGNTKVDSGKIILNGNDITLEKIQKRNIAFVYQDQALFPHLKVFDNIAFSLRHKKSTSTEVIPIRNKFTTVPIGITRSKQICFCKSVKNEYKNKVIELAELVGVTNILYRKPATLSGGEAQRVALARALATQPECLLLDEPLSNIDTQLRYELRSLLRKINRQGQTIIHVTHDYEEAVSLASKLAVIEQGKIVQTGTPEEIFLYPKSEFIAKFIGVKNFYRGKLLNHENSSDLKSFETSGILFHVATDEKNEDGFLLIPAESIVISENFNNSSSRNFFKGKIIDIFPAKLGLEVVVDIGVKITSIVSKEATEKLSLEKNKEIWISFKASSAKFIRL